MKSTSKAKPPANALAILLRVKVDLEFMVFEATTCRFDDKRGLRGIGEHDYAYDDSNKLYHLAGADLRDIEIRSQNSVNSAREGRSAYGFSTEYRSPYRVDRDRARGMFKTLDRLERSLERAYQQDGPANSFDVYLLRVASALRISTFVLCDREPRNFGGGEWHAIDSAAAAAWVRMNDADYLARYAPPKLVESAAAHELALLAS